MAKLLILGGGGYLGSRLSESLAKAYDVTITSRSQSDIRDHWVTRCGIQNAKYNSAEADSLPLGNGPFEAIIHLAMPGASEAAKNPEASLANATKTAQHCMAAIEQGAAKRLLHFSTFHIYGNPVREYYREEDAPNPQHPYGITHAAVEKLFSPHPAITIFRASNMVGAPAHADLGAQAQLFLVDICRQAAAGKIHLNNDGKSHRDFLSFEDAIEAVNLYLTQQQPNDCRLFNLASGTSQRLDDVIQLICKIAPRPIEVTYGSGTDNFRSPFYVTIDRLKQLGWQPSKGLSSEISNLIAFFSV